MAKKTYDEVLALIRPSKEELAEELRFSKELIKKIETAVPPSCKVVLTGSVAKRTFLKHKRDVDVFVLFELSFDRDGMEPAIKKIMKKVFPSVSYQMSYAEHPYARFHFDGRKVDLVPAYKISDAKQRRSAVDRSVLHTRFVLNSLKVGQTDEVLLLKQFLKANSLYGAEIKIKGFSGYLCELLIIKYGTFDKLVKAISKSKLPIIIDLRKYYSKKNSLAERFGQFVVIDPTDKDRNVAAAVSTENIKKFIQLCRSFSKKPSKDFLLRTPPSFESQVKNASKGKHMFHVSMPRPEIVDDVLWGQIYKLAKQLEDYLEDFEAKIMADESRHVVRLAVIVKHKELPSKMLVAGPPLSMKEHVLEFKKAHKNAKISTKKKRVYAEVKRPITKAETAIKNFFRQFSTTDSHLAYPPEMILIEKFSRNK